MMAEPLEQGDELIIDRLLARDNRSMLRRFWDDYILGRGSRPTLTKDEISKQFDWNDDAVAERRVRLMREQLVYEMDRLREQFTKVGVVITFTALLLAFGLNGAQMKPVLLAICLAAGLALYGQMPKFKAVIGHRRRPDPALMICRVNTHLDEFHYLYEWKVRREERTHAAEAVLILATVVGIVALVDVVVVRVF